MTSPQLPKWRAITKRVGICSATAVAQRITSRCMKLRQICSIQPRRSDQSISSTPCPQTMLGTSAGTSIIDMRTSPLSSANIWRDGEYLLIADPIILLSNSWSYLTTQLYCQFQLNDPPAQQQTFHRRQRSISSILHPPTSYHGGINIMHEGVQ